ncbi:neutral zinc metallopeptidase [Streptosporangium sp. G11]|uniref:neutral zinc metallopeptidase n=1 Tax=Streptosporangium sp. G11 TaxID=3436926 RepID=UPI003EB6D077
MNRFWATHWPSLFNGRYSRPTVYGGYSYGGRKPPMCDGKRVGYDNAHYCWSRDMISWDVAYMKDGYRVADVWVYQVIAHEWGHAVQNRLDDSLIWRARELQADCLAGAALYGAARDGTLLFESGDVEELEVVFRKLGDTKPWRKPGDHGSASERVSAFERGARGGVGGCMPD